MSFLERKGNFVHDFKGTPQGIHCPAFPVISLGHGCRFNPPCSYCFLQLTFRMERKPVVYTNIDKLLNDVEKDWAKRESPTLYNAGELSDSLIHVDTLIPLIELFGRQNKHKLLLLSKGGDSDTDMVKLLSLEHNGMAIASFSINTSCVSELYEAGAPKMMSRILDAKLMRTAGYPVRLRIDPMIPVSGWVDLYSTLVNAIAVSGINPEIVTLGSLRYQAGVKARARDKTAFVYANEKTLADKRYRVDFKTRTKMYTRMIDMLTDACPNTHIGLCKETTELFNSLNLDPESQRCNCLL